MGDEVLKTNKPCSVEGCARPSEYWGLCQTHHQRNLKYGSPTAGPPIRMYLKGMSDEERFWMRVAPPDLHGCKVWTGGQDGKGYGFFSIKGKPVYAHRWIYEQQVGPIPKGFVIDHLCRTPLCVNVHHMEAVTIGENVQRSPSSNRNKTHCPRGHEYTPENMYFNGQSGRVCKICVLLRQKESRRLQSNSA